MTTVEAVDDGRGPGVDVEMLYRTERQGLLRLAVLLTGDRTSAEDLVQDAFVALQRRRAALAEPAKAAGYLRVSVVNGARAAHRRRRVARRYLPLGLADRSPVDPAGALADSDYALIKAVRDLPRRQLEVIVLRYWMDMTEREIAEAMGISTGTVKSMASRALTRLEKRLEDRNER